MLNQIIDRNANYLYTNSLNYKEYSQLNLPETGEAVLKFWKENQIFEKSITNRSAENPFTFYEGPPSANGKPGIHHVMARAIKDIFCRYKTLKGFQVLRKGGWDTHGLPIEIAVEKSLGITKEDIGKKISIEEYNIACKTEVLRYTDLWNDLTEKMGYWVDLKDPYITYETRYIESLWSILKQFHEKGLLYKGYTVQPYSPAAGTGLSSHELNQPGTYKMLKDTSITAKFTLKYDQQSAFLFTDPLEPVSFLAWTTTPWTLPSNCALAVGPDITYVKVSTFNLYTFLPESVILAKELVSKHFTEKAGTVAFEDYSPGDKLIPWRLISEFKAAQLVGLHYYQLMPYVTSEELEKNAFRVITANFVTTEDGTGIVHTASIFGADDFKACRDNGVPSVMGHDSAGNAYPLVNKQGKFTAEVTDFVGRYVRAEYESDEVRADPAFKSTDVLISIFLKEENKAFKVEKYEHSYPHCWRTDKPILYYPLDSWFIRTTAVKDRMVELNKTINWKPESTGTGRFGNWLENLVDWNLSRSRFWGTPLPVWRSLDKKEEVCIGSVAELSQRINEALASGLLTPDETSSTQKEADALNSGKFDLHRPYVDNIVLTGSSGARLYRELDLIDVWFDSGAMPYAQWHYPFENKEAFSKSYPADFIAEGVDQTRGWFFTLHAISVLLNDSVAYKNVISNGLVLDKNGNKMSKRLGNTVDPFETINLYSADATRWYMIANASPWDNLKFNLEGLAEVQRKFFGTLYNTYAFFALYANIDQFSYTEPEIEIAKRPEIDRWIISRLHSLTKEVDQFYAEYEPTRAARSIQEFVDEHLSNWYIRLCRRRFWKGDYTADKVSAYQTLYQCLETISLLISPISPFFSEQLFSDLNAVTRRSTVESVHLSDFPIYNPALIDVSLEEQMQLAQIVSSLVLSLRKKVDIRVRQPLNKIMIPILDDRIASKIENVKHLILSETNVKQIEFITDTSGVIIKKIKPNFKTLGPKAGKLMKEVAQAIQELDQLKIAEIEKNQFLQLTVQGQEFTITLAEVEIASEDIPGWLIATNGNITIALDVHLSDSLKQEGLARELVNRIQNLRKEKGFQVTDKINVTLENQPVLTAAVKENLIYICAEILGVKFDIVDSGTLDGDQIDIEDIKVKIRIERQ